MRGGLGESKGINITQHRREGYPGGTEPARGGWPRGGRGGKEQSPVTGMCERIITLGPN